MGESIGLIHRQGNPKEFRFKIVFLKCNGEEIRTVRVGIWASTSEEAEEGVRYLAWEEMTDSISRFLIEKDD